MLYKILIALQTIVQTSTEQRVYSGVLNWEKLTALVLFLEVTLQSLQSTNIHTHTHKHTRTQF